ncbi:MAG: hypothetical protein KGJ13_03635 [Patescibacteria group bacterium]|nr:hypothetical protein [Patescibacteria group bacterium]MDE2019414.1 hypothetical protein [Patescibacteria group bacterium]
MTSINFTIRGNPDDPNGNPLPKIKKTKWQQWTPQAKRYAAWKEYAQMAFRDAIAAGHPELMQQVGQCLVRTGHPIELGTFEKARMDIQILWKNDAHADAENVFGSIADALFLNDKKLDGSFAGHKAADGKGRVEGTITIYRE